MHGFDFDVGGLLLLFFLYTPIKVYLGFISRGCMPRCVYTVKIKFANKICSRRLGKAKVCQKRLLIFYQPSLRLAPGKESFSISKRGRKIFILAQDSHTGLCM